MTMTRRATLLSLTGAAFAGSVTAAGAQTPKPDARPVINHLLATASPGGSYFPAGVALSTVIRIMLEPDAGVTLSAITTAGSIENLKLLREKEVGFAFAQGLFGFLDNRGLGPFKEAGANDSLRSVAALWPDVEHLILTRDKAKSGTLADLAALKGSVMAFGDKGSGALGSTTLMLANLDLDIDADFEQLNAPYDTSAQALARGQVAGLSMPAGDPAPALVNLFKAAGDRIRPLDVTDAELERINANIGLWRRHVIPAGTYPDQTRPWTTVAQPNFLATRADLPDEHVYDIARTMFEHLSLLQGLHPALESVTLESALDGLPAPLHPGAVQLYRERGLQIPKRLLPA